MKNEKDTSANQSGAPIIPNEPPQTSEGTQQNNPPQPIIITTKDKGIFYLTLALVLITAVYSFFSYQQWQTMQNALIRADSSNVYTRKGVGLSEQSIKASEKSLTISEKNLEISKMTMIATNAPYISIHVKMDVFSIGKPIKITVSYFNIGKTPALSFGLFTESTIHKPDSFKELGKAPGHISFSKGTIFPNDKATTTLQTSNILNSKMDSIIRNGIAIESIHGEIHYKDIFDNSYTTTFYWIYNPETNEFGTAQKGNSYKKNSPK